MTGERDDAPPSNETSATWAAICANVNDMMTPMIEWANGQRQSLVALGWSEAGAEAIAIELLQGMIRKVLAS